MMACVTGAGRNAPPGASREPVGTVGNRYCGKRITREEKRRQQRLRANLIGVALAAALVAAGVILGLTAGVRL